MITTDEIKKALEILAEKLAVDYKGCQAAEIEELDNAIDLTIKAATSFANLGADNYQERATDERNKEYARGYAEARSVVENIIEGEGVLFLQTDADLDDVDVFSIQPKKGAPVDFERAREPGCWEPMDREDYPLPHPMLVCSECLKTNHYPGKYCTYCGSENGVDE